MTLHGKSLLLALSLVTGILFSQAPAVNAQEVSVTSEMVTMPTYKMGPDEKHPVFRGFTVPGRHVPRSQRTTYPYPRADNFAHDREDVEYEAITLENEFIKTVIMPDLRGRLQGAYDKRNGWDFLYYNNAIKPGEIGNRPGWLSGGLEWNHPGGHGYTQFERISTKIIEHEDGSKTVLVAEIEPVRLMKWETAITLRPGSLAIETEGRFYSIAPYPVPFASSLNGAMHTSDELEVIYPEGTYISGHGKKYIQPWPEYDGVDHRWFHNLKSSYSIFSEGLTEDFYGCYSHDKNGGTVIVTDHRTAPGKKYFAWGSHPAGRRWDTLLSDKDGGYIELQVGAFWDNLGYGNAWLDPMEVKKFTVYWYPVKDIGGFVSANKDVVLNLKPDTSNRVNIGIQAVHMLDNSTILVTANERTIFEKHLDLDPETPYVNKFALPAGIAYEDLKVTIRNTDGQMLLAYQPMKKRPPVPELPAMRLEPEEAKTIDDLHMWGKGFYQDPFGEEAEDYFREILKRAPMDARGNREMGLLALHRGQYESAIRYFDKSFRNDPLNSGFTSRYYTGLAALEMEDFDRAREAFNEASRVRSMKVPAVYGLALIAMQEGDYRSAVNLLNEAIEDGGVHPKIYSTLAVAWRKLGNTKRSANAAKQALAKDPLEFLAMLEQWKAGVLPTTAIHKQFDRPAAFVGGPAPYFVGSQLYVEGAVYYDRLGALDDAVNILEEGIRHLSLQGDIYPMMEYYLGYLYAKQGRNNKAADAFARAGAIQSDYVFPCRPIDIAVLNAAVKNNPSDARAWDYMGNALFYLRRYEEAEQAWLKSAKNDPNDSRVLRCLAFVDWALRQDMDRAIERLETAAAADPSDSRILLELDYFLDEAGNTERRLELLSERENTVKNRDELVLVYSRLLLRKGKFTKAAEIMDAHRFYAREARRDVHAIYAEAHYGAGEQALTKGMYESAIEEFEKGMQYPESLGEGSYDNEVFARAQYLIGVAWQKAGDKAAAKRYFQKVADQPVQENTESIIYKALALRELGKDDKATELLHKTESLCRKALTKGKDEAPLMHYLLSRTLEEMGNQKEARTLLQTALINEPDVVLQARIAASK
jgi:tetratricopeptide (TPR) repeat protein